MGKPTTGLDRPVIAIFGDGKFQPNLVLAHSIHLGVAQRMDVIVDLSNDAGSTVCLVDHLEQGHGRSPDERKIDSKDLATKGDFFAANALMAIKVGALAEDAAILDYGTPEASGSDPQRISGAFSAVSANGLH